MCQKIWSKIHRAQLAHNTKNDKCSIKICKALRKMLKSPCELTKGFFCKYIDCFVRFVEYMSAFHTEVAFHYRYKLQVDYQAVAFRELIILLACAGGYSFSTMRKK